MPYTLDIKINFRVSHERTKQTNTHRAQGNNRAVLYCLQSEGSATIEGLLTSTFTFTSPYDDAIERAMYFERCWSMSDRIRQHVLERIFFARDEAFVTYRAITFEGMEFRNTEFFTFEGGQISSVNVYFGAAYNSDGVFIRKQ